MPFVERHVTNSLEQAAIFQRPLIVGASISGDRGTFSPGKRLSLRHAKAEDIRTVARGGTPGREIVKLLRESDLADRTCVLAMDLFFWDSAQQSIRESFAALEWLMSFAKKLRIPVVLGEIPELLPGFQPNAKALNAEIHRQANTFDLCRIMPFESLYQQLLRTGSIEVSGRRLRASEIIPDGLHLSSAASEFLADVMLSLFV